MPIPSERTIAWPPPGWEIQYEKFREWAAWYSGDPDRLREFYGTQNPPVGSTTWARFWGRIGARPTNQKAQFHVPIAGDLSSVSSALLFGVPPIVRVRAAHTAPAPVTGDTPPATPRTDPAAARTELRLKDILARGGAYNRLIEGGETGSAMGGVFLYPGWDESVADIPIVMVAQADAALPKFRLGQLESVLFHREVAVDGKIITRHVESHDRVAGGNAVISNALFRGNEVQLGERLSDAALKFVTGLDPMVELPFPELDVEYIPNMRPNRLWRASQLGMSDYSGSEMLFDALDEVYASWMRDIRLAKARIIVPKEFLDEIGAFDVDHEVFTGISMEPNIAAGSNPIVAQQFNIRNEAYLATALELVERIVSNAGYSPQTYGLHIMGRAESGTALRLRENRTMMTMARKGSWWAPAMERLFKHMLQIDAAVFNSGVEPMDVEVEMSESMVRDPDGLAQTANMLKQANAASTQERVKLIHPDWAPEEVAAEVARILDENKAPAVVSSASPTGPPIMPPDSPLPMSSESMPPESTPPAA